MQIYYVSSWKGSAWQRLKVWISRRVIIALMDIHMFFDVAGTCKRLPTHGAGISAQFEVHFPDMLVEPTGLGKGTVTLPAYISLQRENNSVCEQVLWLNFDSLAQDCSYSIAHTLKLLLSQIARFMGPTWGPSGAVRTQVGPMLAPWTLLSGVLR